MNIIEHEGTSPWEKFDGEIKLYLEEERQGKGRFSTIMGADGDDFQLVFEFGHFERSHWKHESMVALGGSFKSPEHAFTYVDSIKLEVESIAGESRPIEPPLLLSGNPER